LKKRENKKETLGLRSLGHCQEKKNRGPPKGRSVGFRRTDQRSIRGVGWRTQGEHGRAGQLRLCKTVGNSGGPDRNSEGGKGGSGKRTPKKASLFGKKKKKLLL